MEGWNIFYICFLLMTMACYLCSARTIDERIRDAMTDGASREGGISRIGDKVLVELDMWLTPEQRGEVNNPSRRAKRKAYRPTSAHWPNGTVNYVIHSSISDASVNSNAERDIRVIMGAITAWETYTCLRFLPAQGSESSIARFTDGDGCSSGIGVWTDTQYQPITLGRSCRYHEIVVHEIGHAVGFFHEQSRPDRDDYVTIMLANIESRREHNFKKYSEDIINTYGVPYDYTSIMHYGSHYFSKNGQPTIMTKNRAFQSIIGNAVELSLEDVQLGNLMYSCNFSDGLPCEKEMFLFLCEPSQKCINLSLRCDGKEDCFRGEDEVGCGNSSPSTITHSPTTPSTIGPTSSSAPSLITPSTPDPTTFSTLRPTSPTTPTPTTSAPTCGPSEFDCLGDGSECVESDKLCDGTEDCEAGQDELGCDSSPTPTPTTSAPTCGPSEFDCLGDGSECVESDKLCDGREDCEAGQDELGCDGSCALYQLDCTGQGIHCVNKSKLCDFNEDCPNGKDEQFYCQCGEGQFDCLNSQCVPWSARCDGQNDCSNSADEQSCPAKKCEQNPCEQICQNWGYNRYRCRCRWPFRVNPRDRTKCSLRGAEPRLLFATPTYTQLVGVDSKREVENVYGFDGLSAVASDSFKHLIIFVEKNTIKFYTTRGPVRRVFYVLFSGLGQVEGIAPDYLNNVIFFADSQKKTIEAVHLYRRKRVAVVSNLFKPMSVAVSPKTGFLFWSDHGSSTIERSHMDGSSRRVIMTNEEVYKPVSLTLDHDDRRLYWVESELNAIGSCDYYGMRISTIASPMPGGLPTSVVPYRNYLFVAGTSNSVVKVQHNRGRATRTTPTVVAQPGTTVVDMVVHHRAVQINARKVCRAFTCAHLCVAVPRRNTMRSKCLCPAGKTSYGRYCR